MKPGSFVSHPHTEFWIIPASLIKGVAMTAIILGVAEAGFWQAIAVAACSATITGIFLLVSASISSKRTGEKVQEVKEKIEDKPEVKARENGA